MLGAVCVQEWIMEQWEKNFYISAIAGANNGSSLVVMSKGRGVEWRGGWMSLWNRACEVRCWDVWGIELNYPDRGVVLF